MDKNELKEQRKRKRAKTRKQVRKNKKFWIIIAEVVAVILLIVLLVGAIIVGKLFGKVDKLEKIDKEGVNSDIEEEVLEAMTGYTNVALFGLDNRESSGTIGEDTRGNSDVIMIASLNNKTKEVKLISVYRDTLLNIGAQYGGSTINGINKANAAYAHGGYEAAVKMLNYNLDLNIQDYVVVDWSAVTKVVDELGGIDLNLDKSEIKYINGYIDEINRCLGTKSKGIYTPGMTHLDGVQATAYMRIRYTAGNDFRRASRQRIVLEAMLNKAKQANLQTLYNVIDEVVEEIATSFTSTEIIGYAKDVMKYQIAATTGFPTYLCTSSMIGSSVVPLTLETNVQNLHKFMFGNETYKASETVHSISEMVKELTGTDENTKTDYDVSEYNDTVGKDNAFD